jgi:antitoxin Phd
MKKRIAFTPKRLPCSNDGTTGTLAMATWQLQDAEAHLDAVIERAQTEGPQTIAHGEVACAVILSIDEYRALAARKPSFKAHLLGGPKFDNFTVECDPDVGRPIVPLMISPLKDFALSVEDTKSVSEALDLDSKECQLCYYRVCMAPIRSIRCRYLQIGSGMPQTGPLASAGTRRDGLSQGVEI